MDAPQVENQEGVMRKTWFLILAAAMVYSTAATGCGKAEKSKAVEEKPVEMSKEKDEDSVQHKVTSFNLEGLSDKGEKKWDVSGQSAEAISENEVKLDNIVAKAYGDSGEATITADKGVYDRSKNNVKLEENVKATIENTRQSGDDFLRMPGRIVPSVEVKEKEEKPKAVKTKTVITCDGAVEFDYENNKAYFDENVKVVGDDGTIDADRITIHLDPETRKVNDIVAEGNVKIMRGENVTYSDRATFIEAERKIVLSGNPKLIIYQEGSFESGFSLDKK